MTVSKKEELNLNSLREQVKQYVENCHLDDGGYFFAKMLPSSAMDTYYAVKTLSLLGLKPDRPEKIKRFFLRAVKKNSILSINGLFSATEVLHELNADVEFLYQHLARLNLLRNVMGGFGAIYNLDIAVVSELETTYRVLSILTRLGRDFDRKQLIEFVFKYRNDDGGFGRNHISTMASTYYATEIFKLTGYGGTELDLTVSYLRSRENVGNLNYIEDMYWLTNSLFNLGQKIRLTEWIISFVKGCQRPNGGFARKDVMGIPTLDDTYYAVSILKNTQQI